MIPWGSGRRAVVPGIIGWSNSPSPTQNTESQVESAVGTSFAGFKPTTYQFHGRHWADLEVEIKGAETSAVESTTPIKYTIQQLQQQQQSANLKKHGAKIIFGTLTNNSYFYSYYLSFLPTLLQFCWHKHFSRSNLVLWPNILAENTSIIMIWCIQNE